MKTIEMTPEFLSGNGGDCKPSVTLKVSYETPEKLKPCTYCLEIDRSWYEMNEWQHEKMLVCMTREGALELAQAMVEALGRT